MLRQVGPSEALYRAHYREIIARLVAGDNPNLATDAELLVAFNEAAQRAPLNDAGTYLYIRLFTAVFGADAARRCGLLAGELAQLERWHGATALPLLDKLRVKYALDHRSVRVYEQEDGDGTV